MSLETLERSQVIRQRLMQMKKMAEEINCQCDQPHELAKENKYLRICGGSFTPISLSPSAPLLGYGRGKSASLHTALIRFSKEEPKIDSKTLEKKEERRLQAWMIREALLNGRSLKNALSHCLPEIDDVVFALDELSLGDKNCGGAKRCDLLCIALKQGNWHPLVIELKSRRVGEKLAEQVEDYAKEMTLFREDIDPLLQAITGMTVAKGEILKMVIFPAPEEKNSSNKKAVMKTYGLYEKKGITLLEYTEVKGGSFSFIPACW